MKKGTSQLSKEYFLLVFSVFAGVLFFLMDTLGILSPLRSGISFVVSPVAYEASVIGREGREYLETFIRLREFRDEYNQLSIDIYEKEVENSFYTLLKEENESLKKQIALVGVDQNYIMAKVLNGEEYDFLRINKGESSGVVVGDVVTLGNMFVGIVTGVDRESSLVRLATNRSSNLEVIVVKKGVEEGKVREDISVLARGGVNGSADGIRIENIAMDADISNGDVVVVNDSKVGEYLILGYLVGLSENPAATSRTGYVSSIVDYNRLVTVFVRVTF